MSKNLAEEWLKKTNDPDLLENYTVDDFFDEMEIPPKHRSDFALAAILKQAKEINPKENNL